MRVYNSENPQIGEVSIEKSDVAIYQDVLAIYKNARRKAMKIFVLN